MSNKRQPREWAIHLNEYDGDEDAFRDAARVELAQLENMMYRLGRGFVVAPLRQPLVNADGDVVSYATVGYAFSEEFMPALKSDPQPQEEPEPDAEPEPTEAG